MRMFTTTDVFHDMSGWQLVSQFCAYGQLTLCAINRTLTSNQPTTNRHRNHLATIAQPRGHETKQLRNCDKQMFVGCKRYGDSYL